MKSNFPPCVYAETLLELPNLSASDTHVAEQYLPMIVEYYKQSLLTHQKALSYLETVYGISSAVALEHSIGYSDRSLGLELPSAKDNAGEILRGSLKRLRVFKGTGHEAFRGCIVVPVMSGDSIAGFYAERINRVCRKAKSQYFVRLYPHCLFATSQCDDHPEVYLCASPLLAIQLTESIHQPAFATDHSFNARDEDCAYLAGAGVDRVIVVAQSHTAPEHLKQLTRRLKKFDLKYRKIDNFTEVVYGTA
ncbi:hypothetical protein [Pseudoalteromonas rubra]|uniref:Uncharacterized protein n=1 Tax=Pseudoalteromonas rubra TaxID=43658 RepID=A0A0F4QLZ9_9GAMM|nr:hypothetical protein [Pseudoalteromonas rubra]KJZ08364.1 hypothetical protein TW77_13250 [Pseudoalteromonas rubra]